MTSFSDNLTSAAVNRWHQSLISAFSAKTRGKKNVCEKDILDYINKQDSEFTFTGLLMCVLQIFDVKMQPNY